LHALKEGVARYPSISAFWERNWEKNIPFLSYPPAVLKAMYMTNALESLNMALRKIIKNRGHFLS
jgi:transposase-like protein